MAQNDDPRLRHRLILDLGILTGYVALTVVMTWPMAREFAVAIPGDGFDGWQNYWNLWWVRTALIDQHTGPFFTNLLFYPTGVSLLFHTLNVFNGLVSLPVQLAFGLLPAYNSVVLFSFAIGGFGAYLLSRHILGDSETRFPALAAGVVFTFSPFHFAHLLGHMQVISLEWIPFYALYLLRIVEAPRHNRALPREILLATLFLVLVGLCDLYYVLYGLIFTVVVLSWASWRGWRSSRTGLTPEAAALGAAPRAARWRQASGLPQAFLGVGAVWMLFGLILSPQLAPMIAEARQSSYMVPAPSQSRVLSADLLAFVTPQEFHPLWGKWAAERGELLAASPAEHQVFAGFTVLVLAAIGLWRGLRGTVRGLPRPRATASPSMPRDPERSDAGPWPLSLLVFSLLALGPVLHIGGRTALLPGARELPLPYGWLVRVVPFVDITRSVSRFDVMVMLSLSALVAIALQWLWSRRTDVPGAGSTTSPFSRRNLGGRIAGVAALALILFEFLPVPYPMSPPDTPAWYGMLKQDLRSGAVLNLPMAWDRPGYLLQQTAHGKPLTVAYISRDDPRTLTERTPVLQHLRHLGPDIIQFSLAAQGKQVLSDLGVRWVVLDRYQMPAGEERAYTEAAAVEIFGDQPPVYEDDRLTVYEVSPPEHSAPYLILGEGWQPFDREARARSLQQSATVIVRSPASGDVTLLVTLAPGSVPLDLPGSGGRHVLTVPVQKGDNVVVLRTVDTDRQAAVVDLSLNSAIEEEAK